MDDRSDGSAILRVATGAGTETGGAWLILEAALFAGIGAILVGTAGLPEAGTFSVFLAAAALNGRMRRLLDRNREAIWEHGEKPWVANQRTAMSMTAIFLGMGLAFVGFAAVVGADNVTDSFGATLRPYVGRGDILTRRFAGELWPLIAHNLGVMAMLMVLGFVYRTYGALLALGWNAAIWAVVLTVLISRGLDRADLHPLVFSIGAIGAVLPHLILELAGYVVGALAALFSSLAVTRYRVNDPRLWRVLRSAALLTSIGIGLVVVGALVERSFAPWMLERLR